MKLLPQKKRSQDLYDKINAKEGGTSSPSSFRPFQAKREDKVIRELHIGGAVYTDPQEVLEQMLSFHSSKVGGLELGPQDEPPP